MLALNRARTTKLRPRNDTRLPALLAVALSAPLWFGCGSGSDGDDGDGSGGAPTGGASVGGTGAGGAATGGVSTGAVSSGGIATGGIATGGLATGGLATGGLATGGLATGGLATGGLATGGLATGGAPTGGIGSGGVGAGGAATGGAPTGGADGTGGAQSTGSPGCGSSNPLQSGTVNVDINGTSRMYILDVPTNYDPDTEYPLVFVWHPLGGSANQVAGGDYNGLKSLANGSAIFVAPDGLDGSNNEASGRGWWNVGDGDMNFLQNMLDNFNANLCIDQDRIFSTGFSFGGMMSYTVPFEFDVFRAVAPCSGDLQVIPHEETFTNPIPIMAFHGDSDAVVSLSRGQAARDQYLSRNNCGTETQPVNPSPCVQYQGCDVPTIWCQFSGGHAPWSEEPQAIWQFFSQF